MRAYSLIHTGGLGTHTDSESAQTFWTREKLSQIVSCVPDGVRASGLWDLESDRRFNNNNNNNEL